MPNSQNASRLKYEAIHSIGSQPPVTYWLSKDPLRQYLIFSISLLILITPIIFLAIGYFINLLVLQQVGVFALIPAIIQYVWVNESLTTIKYITNSELCRKEQVAGCNKIDELNEQLKAQKETIDQLRSQAAQLSGEKVTLHSEVVALRTIKESGQKNEAFVDELISAFEKFIEKYQGDNDRHQDLKSLIQEMMQTLQQNGHRIQINAQHSQLFKDYLFKFFELPETFEAYKEMSELTIQESSSLIKSIDLVLKNLNSECINSGVQSLEGELSPSNKIIYDVSARLSILIQKIHEFESKDRQVQKRQSYSDQSLGRPKTQGPIDSLFNTFSSFLTPTSSAKQSSPFKS